jgi:general secretion pathway protein D
MAPGTAPRRGQFTLNFDDADVYMIIQTVFGEVLKVNYIVDPRVKGRVTFRAVAPVPAENVLPLMEVILRLNGIGVVEESGLYRIVPLSDISKEPSPVSYGRDPAKIPTTGKALLQVVPITYVQSSEVLKLIAPFASTNAVLIDVPKGNQIIIVDTDANVKRLLKLVELFDNETLKKRKPQVFVYQVQNSKAKDIANLLQQIYLGGKATTTERPSTPSRISPSTLGSSQSTPSTLPASSLPQVSTISTSGEILVSDFTRIIPDEITNTVIIMSTPEDYTAIRKTIEEIDVVPRQVVIEGMIASVALTDNLSFGISALFKGNISNFGGSADIGTRFALNPQSLAVDPNNLSLGGFTFVGVDQAGTVRALITALATDSKAKVLAAPHILVSDNRDAKIQVGQQVPLITTETYGSTTIAPQRTFQYRDIGIILKVKPRINAGGLVSLEIYQEISTFETITLSGDQQILLDKTDVTTELVVQDGQTIVIGGLIREDTTKSRSGIPFLSRIPLIGWLFGNTEDDIKRQELIILLTPHVIKNQKEAKDMSTEFVDKMTESSEGRIKKEELIKEKRQKQNGINHPEAPGGKVK